MSQYIHRPMRCHQRGAVALIFGISLVVLIGFAGLALDLGRFFVIKSELQNAVDACALAAASQLRPGQNDANALIKARAYGKLVAGKNRANFQGGAVTLEDSHITFSESIVFPSSTVSYNTASYVMCSYPLSGLPIYFMQVVDPELSTQTVSASAVGAVMQASSACAIPIAVCKAGTGNAGNNYGYNEGEWVTAKSGSSLGKGFFGWIDFTKSGGGKTELVSTLQGAGQCDAVTAASESGNKASVDDAWNSRFGWYDKLNIAQAIPDFTGWAYSLANSTGSNIYADYVVHKNTYATYQGNVPRGMPAGKYTTPTLTANNTAPRRVAKAPIMDCSDLKNETPIVDWACVLMLNPIISTGNPKIPPKGTDEDWQTAKVEFIGLISKLGSPCASPSVVLGQ
jgi:Flp pilus assembly protein TadG